MGRRAAVVHEPDVSLEDGLGVGGQAHADLLVAAADGHDHHVGGVPEEGCRLRWEPQYSPAGRSDDRLSARVPSLFLTVRSGAKSGRAGPCRLSIGGFLANALWADGVQIAGQRHRRSVGARHGVA